MNRYRVFWILQDVFDMMSVVCLRLVYLFCFRGYFVFSMSRFVCSMYKLRFLHFVFFFNFDLLSVEV